MHEWICILKNPVNPVYFYCFRTSHSERNDFAESVPHLCKSPFSTTPGSSSNWIEEAGPRSGFVHSRNAQTTFLSGVTSIIWTTVGQFSFLVLPAQLQITVFPFASRLTS